MDKRERENDTVHEDVESKRSKLHEKLMAMKAAKAALEVSPLHFPSCLHCPSPLGAIHLRAHVT